MDFVNGSKEYLDSNNFVAKISFIILIIICFVILFNIGYWVISMFLSPSKTPLLVDGMVDAKVPLSIPQAMNQKNAKPIYRSNDQYNGLEFTWTTWMYVNDPTYLPTQNTKNVFVKGNRGYNSQSEPFATNGPGVYLYNEDPNISSNYPSGQGQFNNLTMQLHVILDIFPYKDPIDNTTKYNQTIIIKDMPIKKWVNLIIRCSSQNIVDVFINGTLVQRAKLYNTVKQNYDNVYVSQNGGFDGFISNLKYFNYSIGTFEIDNIVSNGPNLKIDKDTNLKQSNPYYLSTKWLFNESSPTPSQSFPTPSQSFVPSANAT